jgi:Na+/proline symporter
MLPFWIPLLLISYLGTLLFIARLTQKKSKQTQSPADSNPFFLAGKQVPWYLVAWGMIGNSLSGVTFISVPGLVGTQGMIYLQVVSGYILGYTVIAGVLLPIYYKMSLTTIYTYLLERLGMKAYKTGSWFFILSRLLGTSARLFLVADILQTFIFQHWGIPFSITVTLTLLLILGYTLEGGMATLVWTDALQSLFLVGALVLTILYLPSPIEVHAHHPEWFRCIDWNLNSTSFWGKQFLGGALIAIVMTGLDQDQMQKNLICKNLKDAQKNMLSFSVAIAIVNVGFLILGAGLYYLSAVHQIDLPAKTDHMYPYLALNYLGKEIPILAALFLLGLTASAYSSADGALTALTTSFCIDILGFERKKINNSIKVRKWVHAGMALSLWIIINLFYQFQSMDKNGQVIHWVLTLATYTYGPLLGMFAFGLFTHRKVKDNFTPWIACSAPIICVGLQSYASAILPGYTLGYELLLINALLVFSGLWLCSIPKNNLSI